MAQRTWSVCIGFLAEPSAAAAAPMPEAAEELSPMLPARQQALAPRVAACAALSHAMLPVAC